MVVVVVVERWHSRLGGWETGGGELLSSIGVLVVDEQQGGMSRGRGWRKGGKRKRKDARDE